MTSHAIYILIITLTPDKALFSLTGYALEIKCRQENSRGGCIGAYIHSSLKYVIQNVQVTHEESLWLQMNIKRKKR